MKKNNIKIKGHFGTFYVIDTAIIEAQSLYLLESEVYGDEAPCIIINKENKIIMEDVFNGFNDYYEEIEG